MKAKVLPKPHSYIYFTLQLDSAWGSSLKRATSSLQPLLVAHGCSLVLSPLPSSSHMAWEQSYKFTNFTAVASFSGHLIPSSYHMAWEQGV